jgi:membrane associated rhomboid family serine protease
VGAYRDRQITEDAMGQESKRRAPVSGYLALAALAALITAPVWMPLVGLAEVSGDAQWAPFALRVGGLVVGVAVVWLVVRIVRRRRQAGTDSSR